MSIKASEKRERGRRKEEKTAGRYFCTKKLRSLNFSSQQEASGAIFFSRQSFAHQEILREGKKLRRDPTWRTGKARAFRRLDWVGLVYLNDSAYPLRQFRLRQKWGCAKN